MKFYTVYECEYCGKKFENEKDCKEHENKEKGKLDFLKKKEKIENDFAKNLETWEEKYIIKYIEDWNLKYNKLKIKLESARLSASNLTVESKGTSIKRPAITGVITGRIEHPYKEYKINGHYEFVSTLLDVSESGFGHTEKELFIMRKFNCGTGGGGPSGFRFFVYMFLDDFPKLKRAVLKEELKG